MKTARIFRSILAALILAACWQTALAGQAKGKDGQAGRLKVMTQNVYVGANLFKILNPEQSIPINAAEIFAVSNVDGGLVGGASLKAADFVAIAAAAG